MRLSVIYWSLFLLVLLPVAENAGLRKMQSVCKGYFCDKYLDTMFILMTHNSFAVAADDPFPNQIFREPQQFKDGIRGFVFDLFEENGRVYMKHGVSTQIDYARNVRALMNEIEKDPFQFVLVQIEDYLTSTTGVRNAVAPWGDKVITNFDINTSLGEYLEQGKQVLLLTDRAASEDISIGMHRTDYFLTENGFQWSNPRGSPNMNFRRGPYSGPSAKMLNYFCKDATFSFGSLSNSAIVNTKTRMQCHAQEFKGKAYANGKINVMMLDHYHVPNMQAFQAQEAIRRGDFGGQNGRNCVQGNCRAAGRSCNVGFFGGGSCDDCCRSRTCSWWVFGCKCS